MVREIMHDTWFLSQKSEKATKADSHIAQDLLYTLKSHRKDRYVRFKTSKIFYRMC